MSQGVRLRELLARQLDWGQAHVSFERAFAGFPTELQGVVPAGFAHSGWQLLEHMRRAQAEILEFCVDPGYTYPESLDGYWPGECPAVGESWESTVEAFARDLAELRRLALDPSVELFASVPTARLAEHTLARALILTTDHNAYHLGQLVALRRVLGAWEDGPGWG